MEDQDYLVVRNGRKAKWQSLLGSYEETAKVLEDGWMKIEQGRKELQDQKDALAAQNGRADVSDADILEINAGGQIVCATRGTLTHIKGSRLEALFSGRWEKQLQRDSKGRIFLDVNPVCFKSILDYLNECKIAPLENPPDLPRLTDPEDQVLLDSLLTAFGLDEEHVVDSKILTQRHHVRALLGFLKEDGLGSCLELIYRGSRDGFDASSFHQKCDYRGPTVTVIKSVGGCIFGGFSDQPWSSDDISESSAVVCGPCYRSSQKSFLFGLTYHGASQPTKLKADHDCGLISDSSCGPIFGGDSLGEEADLFVEGRSGTTNLGNSYSALPGGTNAHFTGSRKFDIADIELFTATVVPTFASRVPPQDATLRLSFDVFPEDIQQSFQTERKALWKAFDGLWLLQDTFQKEKSAVEAFCPGNAGEIAHLNVRGQNMAVKHSTLGQYPNSVLYKQFADPNWKTISGREASPSSKPPKKWNANEVFAWSQGIEGLSADDSQHFQDVTGLELLALKREDIRALGITRPGKVALVMEAIQKLRDEEDQRSAVLIEHSDYCFGKIIDHMRLKAMGTLGVPKPNPPDIREPDKKRFKTIVDYYFPTKDMAAEFY